MRDIQGRPTAKIYPDLTQTTYAYETNTSRLKSVTDAKGQKTLYTYFVDNNLKSVTYTNAVIATPGVSFTYDTNYNRMLTMMDTNGTTTYGYYAVTNTQLGAGRLASVDGPFANDTITYAYDELGRITNRAIDGVGVNLTYDAQGRVTLITNALGSFTNAYVTNTMRLSGVSYPNGQTTAFSYYGTNQDSRLQTIWHQTGARAIKFDYAYDADGQITDASFIPSLRLISTPPNELNGHKERKTARTLKKHLQPISVRGVLLQCGLFFGNCSVESQP